MTDIERLIFDANQRTKILERNHYTLDYVEKDKVSISAAVNQDNTNIYGIVHGGALLYLADVAAGFAALTDGRRHVTQNTSCQFLSNTSTGSIHAEGVVLHRSRNTAAVRVEILDDQRRLLFESLFTMFVVQRPIIQMPENE